MATVLAREGHAIHGGRTEREQRAVEAFAALFRSRLDGDQLAQLMRALTIWETDPTQGIGRELLISRLAGALVPADDAQRAARELSDEIRRLARLRAGHDAGGLLAALLSRGVPLARGPEAASNARHVNALSAYRERCVRLGSTLRLFGVAAALADIPLEDADAGIRVNVEGKDSGSSGEQLASALRRRGRICLIGAPGAGKSTALRSLSALWATKASWPVPILVHSRELSAGGADITDTLLSAATRHVVDLGERDDLRRALSAALVSGECLLALDGFDEIPRGRAAFAQALRDWLCDLPDGCELVVAMRPVAKEQAQILGLQELELRVPDHPEETVSAILGAVADASSPGSPGLGRRATGVGERRTRARRLTWHHAADRLLAHGDSGQGD